MTKVIAYIDPSASSLIIQLVLSTAVGSYFFLRRRLSRASHFLKREHLSAGIWCFVVAVSFANLAMFRVWAELFSYRPADMFEMKHPPLPSHYLAAVLATFALAALVWPVIVLATKPGRVGNVFTVIFLLLWFIPLNGFRDVLGYRYFPMLRFSSVRALGPLLVAVVGGTFVLLAIGVICRHRHLLFRSLSLVLIMGSPFALLMTGASLVRASRYSNMGFQDQASVRIPSGRGKAMRVVWVIFDEMDQRIAFDERPAGLAMPEFDEFRRTGLYSDTVTEAGADTIVAIPSLMVSRRIRKLREAGKDELRVAFEGSNVLTSFKGVPNMFGQLRASGLSSGLVAWGTPYCRMFGADIDRCWWCESPRPDNSISDAVFPGTVDSMRSLFETPTFSIFGQSLCTRHYIQIYKSVTSEAISVATDPAIDVSMLQLTGAHPPHFYNRMRRDFSLLNRPIRGYIDSLALCDVTLRHLRLAMQASGVWDNTVVILSSDHHNRSSRVFDGKVDHRVVFIVRFPGNHPGIRFSRPINAVVTAPLVIKIATGQIQDQASAIKWLDQQPSYARPL